MHDAIDIMYEEESVNRPQMNIKREKCDIRIRKNINFSIYALPTLIHLSHRFTSASEPAAWKYFDWCLSHFRTSVSTSSSAKHLPLRWFFRGPNRGNSLGVKSGL
jgi:hypothetical protein